MAGGRLRARISVVYNLEAPLMAASRRPAAPHGSRPPAAPAGASVPTLGVLAVPVALTLAMLALTLLPRVGANPRLVQGFWIAGGGLLLCSRVRQEKLAVLRDQQVARGIPRRPARGLRC